MREGEVMMMSSTFKASSVSLSTAPPPVLLAGGSGASSNSSASVRVVEQRTEGRVRVVTGDEGGGGFVPQAQVVQRLGREIQELVRAPPEGIRFVPNDEETLTEVHAEIAGPVGTPYEAGSFRMKLVLSRDYPQAPPRAFFLTKLFHPNVSSSGAICVNMLKKDWSPDLKLGHVLMVIRCLLIVPFPESSLNDEAGKLFMESYDEYARRARLMTLVHAITDKKMPASSSSSHASPSTASASPKASSKAESRSNTSSPSTSSSASNTGDSEAAATKGGATAKSRTKEEQAAQQQRDKSKETRRKGLKRL